MTIRSAARRVREVLFGKLLPPELPEVPPLPDVKIDGELAELEASVAGSAAEAKRARTMARHAHVRLLAAPIEQQLGDALFTRRR